MTNRTFFRNICLEQIFRTFSRNIYSRMGLYMKKNLIIKKGRVICILLLFFVFTSGMKFTRIENIHSEKSPTIMIYNVSKGDTLWSIANYYQVGNKQKFISDIAKINKLTEGKIYPGDKLCIPFNE